ELKNKSLLINEIKIYFITFSFWHASGNNPFVISLNSQGVKPRRHVRNGTDRLSGAFRQPITTNGFDSRFHSNENWFVNHRDTRGFAQSALPTAGRR
ncbi:hypothetical protein, partial [Klebsiella oxytoca]|uniref:hypothetical protein n=1 Tax=Klebsiella oxytoca TaxID=571 RepID=UPI001CCCE07F